MPRDSLIALRRGTAAAWTGANPTLAAGEGGFETDTLKFKIGDGSTAWNSLAYQGGSGAVSSVFARTGAVIAVAGDYYGIVAAAATGATAASQYVGATASGAPASGTYAIGDYVVDRTGSFWICTTAGTPGTWTQVASGGGSPTGSAGGVLDGSYPNPGLAAGVAGAGLAETSDVLSVNVDGTTIEIATDTLQVKTGGIGPTQLASTAVTPATYGDATNVGQFTVDADGRITAASAVAITGAATIGRSALVYRYTVTGSDKASIDTGADTADAGSNDWTNGDLLEVLIVARTDDAGSHVNLNVTVNNDTGANYDKQYAAVISTTVSGGTGLAQNQWQSSAHGSGGSASYPIVWRMSIPDYAGTTFFKVVESNLAMTDATAGNNLAAINAFGYRSTAAITRLKVAAVGAAKLKVGSQLLIYKRLAS